MILQRKTPPLGGNGRNLHVVLQARKVCDGEIGCSGVIRAEYPAQDRQGQAEKQGQRHYSRASAHQFKSLGHSGLRSDHLLRRFKLKVPAVAGDTDCERNLIIVVIFEQIEEILDKAIAENRTNSH